MGNLTSPAGAYGITVWSHNYKKGLFFFSYMYALNKRVTPAALSTISEHDYVISRLIADKACLRQEWVVVVVVVIY